ncbi:MAG: hypothetical protein AAFP90_12070, partial [Planctomycetota bacterium]
RRDRSLAHSWIADFASAFALPDVIFGPIRPNWCRHTEWTLQGNPFQPEASAWDHPNLTRGSRLVQ